MKCPECLDSGQTSKVYDHGSTRTLLGGGGTHWDEDGVRHFHEVNTITDCFRCSNGHYWAVRRNKPPCPAPGCTYGQEPKPPAKAQETAGGTPETPTEEAS